MTCPHETDVGAYVLDVLEPGERARVGAHLAGCPACAAVLAELREMPAWLAMVPGEEVADPPVVPSEVAFRRLHRSATARAARPARHPVRGALPGRGAPRGRRLALAAAACLVVAGGAAAGVVLTSGAGHLPSVTTASSGAVHVRARIVAAGSGSAITLTLTGVESGQRCELVAVGDDGRRQTASVWTATYDGTAQVTGTVRMPPDDVRRLVVETLDGRTLVSIDG